MSALLRKLGPIIFILFAGIEWVNPLFVFALPKSRKTAPETNSPPPAQINSPRFTPLVVDESGRLNSNYPASAPVFRYLGPSRVDQAGSPYVDVRVGIPELPGTQNHMRRQAALSPTGAVHMVYSVYSSDPDWVVRSPADSNINGMYFYNAYNCDGSRSLEFGSLDIQMKQVFTGIGDVRPRTMNSGGLFIPPGGNIPVVYGERYIQRTDLGAGRFDGSPWGWATMKDSAECQGRFSMDTSYTNEDVLDPVMHAINESTYVAAFADVANSNVIRFSHTTDRGQSWAALTTAPTYSPWYNSVDITGRGNTFYIVTVADPNDPNAFMTTERPCYLKGTYDPLTGSISFGALTDITGDFELPGYLANFLDVSALMISDTLHVLWTDWNNYSSNGFSGPGGHVHHAAVWPNGAIDGPHKITDINIDGRLPDRSTTLFGFAVEPWPMVSLTYDSTLNRLFALWSTPPDDGNFGWADYEVTGTLACYDIFMAASPNNGRGWTEARNVTQTNNPGCDGSPADPCAHEDQFEVAAIANDTIWAVAMVQRYPGFQETAIRRGITPDVGPVTEHYDVFRLYKVSTFLGPPCFSQLTVPPGDTTNLYQLQLKPRGGTFTTPIRLLNCGYANLYLDSVTLDPALNDGYLITTTNAVPGAFIPSGLFYDFTLSLNTDEVDWVNAGTRSGLLQAYVHSNSPFQQATLTSALTVYVVSSLCFNRSIQIHSGKNRSDVWSQGALVNESGEGLHEGPPSPGGIDRFNDGGVWIANSSLNAATGDPGVPRKVTRQLFDDEFLRCVADGALDSVPGTGGGYYNLFVKSIATDIEDTTLVWQNLWEQSTHPDSSDFLIQTTRVINIGSAPIDSVAMGVCYDIDVFSSISSFIRNVSGDTFVTYNGRKFWLGWTAGPDVSIDSCSPNNEFYGVVGIPGSIGNPGDSVHPRGAVMYDLRSSAFIEFIWSPLGEDSSAQRYMYNLNVCTSTRRRVHDSLTNIWQDTAQAPPYNRLPGTFQICGGVADPVNYGNYGAPRWRDEGYLSVAKKVYNFPTNGGGQAIAARYGLEGLAAGVDTFFSGPGETYTHIHVASASGLAQLMANAITGIDWYVNHANLQVGTNQTFLKGDLNNDRTLSPADAVLELNYVFLNMDGGMAIPVCAADLNNDNALTPADCVFLLNGAFLNVGCPNCLRPCI